MTGLTDCLIMLTSPAMPHRMSVVLNIKSSEAIFLVVLEVSVRENLKMAL